jgi:hypothetical protein
MKSLRAIVVSLIGLAATCFLFRLQIFSGLEYSPGNMLDGRLIVGLTEHWRLVFENGQTWNALPTFWPVKGTLGYSDTFFIHGVIYTLLCKCGLDQWQSFACTFILLALTGYALMYWLLRSCIKAPWLLAAAMSALFINLAPIQTVLFNSHLQLLSVFLCPGLIALGWMAAKGGTWAPAWAAACAVVLAALFFSTYYISWFLTFGICICVAIVLIHRVSTDISRARQTGLPSTLRGKVRAATERVRSAIRPYRYIIIAAVATFALAIIPFLIVYIPVLRVNGGHSFEEMFKTLPQPIDLINLGCGNYAWGWLPQSLLLDTREYPWELHYGIAPVTLLFFLASSFFFARMWLRGKPLETSEKAALVAATAIVICWVLLIKVGSFSGWYFVARLVPGADAIRSVFRINAVIAMFVLIVNAAALKRLYASGGTVVRPLAVLLFAAMFAEQISPPMEENRIRRSEETALMASIQPPPPEAKVFYIKGNLWRNEVVEQNTAFFVAQKYGIETINGYSGQFPPNWHLIDCQSPAYAEYVKHWAVDHFVSDTIYELNTETGTWTKADFALKAAPYTLGTNIVQSDIFERYSVYGWSVPESSWGGVWTVGKSALLSLDVKEYAGKDLALSICFQGFVPRKHPQHIRITANGEEVGTWILKAPQRVKTGIFTIPARLTASGKLDLKIEVPDAISPKDCGIGNDMREVGFGLKFLKLTEAAK